MKRLSVLLGLYLTLIPALTFPQGKTETIREYMQAAVEAQHFNGSVLVAQKNETVFSQGFGMANFEHEVANSPDTKFRIGSITKQFTSMAVMVLQDQGKLKVTDPISNYIDDPPESWSGITIHHLLTHTSGIPSFTSMPDYRFLMAHFQSQDRMLARFRDKSLNFEPSEKYEYSNSGYFVLGVLIEKVSGQSYEEFLREEVLDPLGLRDTGYDHYKTVLKHRATGYVRLGNAISHAPFLDMSQPYSAGALYSTVEDLNRWDQALHQHKLISEESYNTMYTPEKNNYAYGWMVREENGRQRIFHGGGINGFLTFILRYPHEELCVVVLSNLTPSNPAKVAEDLAAIMLGEEIEFPPTRRNSTVIGN